MNTSFPPLDSFLSQLHDLHVGTSNHGRRPILPQHLLDHICKPIADFYESDFKRAPLPVAPRKIFEALLTASYRAVNAFRDALPGWVFAREQEQLLSESVVLDLRSAHERFGLALRPLAKDLAELSLRIHFPPNYLPFPEDMPRFDELEPWFDESEPTFDDDEPSDSDAKLDWRNRKRRFQERDMARWKQRKREFEATEIPAWRQRKADFNDFELARWKERRAQYDKLHKQSIQRTPDEEAFIGTPFYDMWLMLKPELQCQIPLAIEEKWRFGSQFVVGASRTGKTTFLTSQIMQDLDRVVRGEASVIVMESQNEDLVPHLARLALFGKGGALEGKLIYLEPAKNPIAANIFDFGDVSTVNEDDKDELFRTAFDNIEFFLNSVFGAETSSPQITILKYLTQAMPHIPDGNIFTLQQLMTEQGLADNLQHFGRLDPVVLRWLQTKLLSKDFSATRIAVSNRLDALVADTIFRKMFGATDNALDLFLELQKPKVVLINTAGLGGSLEAFGRYFIAKLDEAMLKRNFSPKSSKLPVYFYVDEASEYYANEPRVGKVIDRLGKQMLATIFAVQGTDQFTQSVLSVLQRAAIQAWTLKPPVVNISVNRKEPVAVNVTRVQLKDLPWVSEEEFQALRQTMRVRYGRLNTREESPPFSEPSPEPIADPPRPPAL